MNKKITIVCVLLILIIQCSQTDRGIPADDPYMIVLGIAFLDGTFYGAGELPGRDMADIPHPFVQESMEQFSGLPSSQRSKIHFIHMNHSNPLLQDWNGARHSVLHAGFNIASEGYIFPL